jgi:hypothetical protein
MVQNAQSPVLPTNGHGLGSNGNGGMNNVLVQDLQQMVISLQVTFLCMTHQTSPCWLESLSILISCKEGPSKELMPGSKLTLYIVCILYVTLTVLISQDRS